MHDKSTRTEEGCGCSTSISRLPFDAREAPILQQLKKEIMRRRTKTLQDGDCCAACMVLNINHNRSCPLRVNSESKGRTRSLCKVVVIMMHEGLEKNSEKFLFRFMFHP